MSERYGRDEEDGYVADMSITETIDGVEYGEEVEDVVAELNALNVRAERAEVLLRRCAIELSYVASVENCGSGLCASSEGAACIEAAEKLLGPMRQWPELRGEEGR
jgi:acyl CoA:acetate/3-ketoacid CoA transferase